MTFAYLILAHKNPGQLSRLVNALTATGVYFFIHIDKKAEENAFKSLITGDNVFFCKNRKTVNWGGFSMIEATVELIGEMTAQIGFPDYVHLLSAQDFPLKSNEYIFNYFEHNKGANFIEYFTIPCANWTNRGLDRIKYKWNIDERGFEKTPELRNRELHDSLSDIIPYGGSQWWSLTGDAVAEIFDKCNQGSELYEFYRYTYIPDEMLFQTFLMNSKFKDTVKNNNLRQISWNNAVVLPGIWKIADFNELNNSFRLFARKFDENEDNLILDKMETYLQQQQTLQQNSGVFAIPVSVVMPVYNAEQYLRESVDSILSQTYRDFELIIIDDGSEDGSVDLVKSYDDDRIRLIRMPHNFIDSLNAGISEARGKYIVRMDADDIMDTKRIEMQFEYMESHLDIDVCGTWASFFGTMNSKVCTLQKHADIACSMMFNNSIVHPSAIIRSESMRKYSLSYKHEYVYAEDYKLWTDFLMHGCKLANIPYFLLNYRCGNTQVTQKHAEEMNIVAEKIKHEYQEYVLNRLSSAGDDVAEFVNKLRLLNTWNHDKTLQIIPLMYRNLLNSDE
ncbi:MAG: glycosyltransferase [Prevotellaceae bacterium]|jgi:glycosyltransferase involved in cell wall biosynthesis|nr:glycosyltransferase [Prevotellaceae bacterium]